MDSNAPVQGTSDDAAVSKLSAATLGYFKDDFLRYFVTKSSRRSPLINRGYYARVAAVSTLLTDFIEAEFPTNDNGDGHDGVESKDNSTSQRKQIVSLGAGFDTTYFRLKSNGVKAYRYFEVDFPDSMRSKARIIRRRKELQDVLQDGTEWKMTDSTSSSASSSSSNLHTDNDSQVTENETTQVENENDTMIVTNTNTPAQQEQRAKNTEEKKRVSSLNESKGDDRAAYLIGASECPDYRLVGADLRDLNLLETRLLEAGFDFNLPTFFLSECVLVYIEPRYSDAIIAWVASKFSVPVAFATYEQILPHDPFGRTMLNNLRSRGCSLKSMLTYPDIPAQAQRFLSRGWDVHAAWDMNDMYKYYLDRNDVKRVESLEMFDEFEEWHIINAHYCISMAIKHIETFGLIGLEKTDAAAPEIDERTLKLQAILKAKEQRKQAESSK